MPYQHEDDEESEDSEQEVEEAKEQINVQSVNTPILKVEAIGQPPLSQVAPIINKPS